MVKPDRRVQRTRQMLQHALLALMQEQGYDTVTVQDIIDRANVGRSTFYAHFKDKEDLLARSMDQWQEVFPRQPATAAGTSSASGSSLLSFSLPLFQHAQTNYSLYRALVVKGGSAKIEQYAERLIATGLHEGLTTLVRAGNPSRIPVDVLTRYTVTVFMTLLKWWLDNGIPCSAEEVDTMFCALVSSGLGALDA